MKTLITADRHYSDNPRDQYRHDFDKWLRKMVVRHGVDRVAILGDLTESKDRHSARLVNKVVGHLHALAKLCPVVILRGNHDYETSPENPFFRFSGRIENITWINVPATAGDELFLPHSTNYKRDWASIDLAAPSRVFTHNTFTGAVGDNGQKLKGIPLDVFPDRGEPYVYSGDVHGRQQTGPVIYVGAPYTIDFGDNYVPRLLLIDEADVRSIRCEGPQKRLVRLTGSLPIPDFTNLRPGDILKVQIQMFPKYMERWQEIKDKAYDWARKKDYVVHLIQPMLTGGGEVKPRKVRAPRSDEEVLSQYGKARQIDDRRLKTGHFLLRKA